MLIIRGDRVDDSCYICFIILLLFDGRKGML